MTSTWQVILSSPGREIGFYDRAFVVYEVPKSSAKIELLNAHVRFNGVCTYNSLLYSDKKNNIWNLYSVI